VASPRKRPRQEELVAGVSGEYVIRNLRRWQAQIQEKPPLEGRTAIPTVSQPLAGLKPAGAKVLLIGMGGGSIATELKKMGFQLDIVEIDPRMFRVAKEYFMFDPRGVREFVDDGRHFIRSVSDKYGLVVIDVCNGEIQPNHMFTKKPRRELRNILSPDGLILINFQGYVYERYGRAARSLIKTLLMAGMPRNASGMPRNSNTDAERGQIQYNHNKGKQIHSHGQSDCGVHCQNANQPEESGLLDPNENWVTELDQAD
jgi:hypothetical protein